MHPNHNLPLLIINADIIVMIPARPGHAIPPPWERGRRAQDAAHEGVADAVADGGGVRGDGV